MKKFILSSIALVLFPFGHNRAQTNASDQLRFHINMVDEDTRKPLQAMQLVLSTEGEQDQVYATDSLGKFPQVNLTLSRSYRMIMSGKNYLTKIIEVDVRGYPNEDRHVNGIDVQLETKMVDKSFLGICQAADLKDIENTVFTRLRYNQKKGGLDWDIQSVERIKNRIDDCRKE